MMTTWDVSEDAIKGLEKLLLPPNCRFADDAKAVIRCWESKDIAACPGSGKTTVLLAKIKLLADKMPLENGAGICVLSHTNVAVDEIKKRLSADSNKLLGYPNYIGTIQSFIDRFVTMPYIRNKYGRTVQPVDEQVFAEHLFLKICSGKYRQLFALINNNYRISRYSDRIDYVKELYLDKDKNLRIKKQEKRLAGNDKLSAQQFYNAEKEVLISDKIIRYNDTYPLAKEALKLLSAAYINMFSDRFRYVFIDEYQDCSEEQRVVIDRLFDSARCNLIRIGDPDQAIYNSLQDDMKDWIPDASHMSIASSCRYAQEVANILVPLRKEEEPIVSSVGECGYKPVLIVFDNDAIDKVINQFVKELDRKGIIDSNGRYCAVGFVGKESVAGLKIGSYWNSYENDRKKQNDYNYWLIIGDICDALQKGNLYKAEKLIRKVLCRILHYNGEYYTFSSIKDLIKLNYSDVYSECVIELAELSKIDKDMIDVKIHKIIDSLFAKQGKNSEYLFAKLPPSFIDKNDALKTIEVDDNVYVDPVCKRKINFCTIHSVKGQTHDATLYLETERHGASDLSRILCCYGIGKANTSSLFDYSRKLAYVGFSRPRKLLCVAMQVNTYNKCKSSESFIKKWEVVNITEHQ